MANKFKKQYPIIRYKKVVESIDNPATNYVYLYPSGSGYYLKLDDGTEYNLVQAVSASYAIDAPGYVSKSGDSTIVSGNLTLERSDATTKIFLTTIRDTGQPQIVFSKAMSGLGSVTDGKVLGRWWFRGYESIGGNYYIGNSYEVNAVGVWTDTSRGTETIIYTIASGSTDVLERFKITSTGSIRFNDAYTFPMQTGSAGQALLEDGNGNLYWGNSTSASFAISASHVTDPYVAYINKENQFSVTQRFNSNIIHSNSLDIDTTSTKFTSSFESNQFWTVSEDLSSTTLLYAHNFVNEVTKSAFDSYGNLNAYGINNDFYIKNGYKALSGFRNVVNAYDSGSSNFNGFYNVARSRAQDNNTYTATQRGIYNLVNTVATDYNLHVDKITGVYTTVRIGSGSNSTSSADYMYGQRIETNAQTATETRVGHVYGLEIFNTDLVAETSSYGIHVTGYQNNHFGVETSSFAGRIITTGSLTMISGTIDVSSSIRTNVEQAANSYYINILPDSNPGSNTDIWGTKYTAVKPSGSDLNKVRLKAFENEMQVYDGDLKLYKNGAFISKFYGDSTINGVSSNLHLKKMIFPQSGSTFSSATTVAGIDNFVQHSEVEGTGRINITGKLVGIDNEIELDRNAEISTLYGVHHALGQIGQPTISLAAGVNIDGDLYATNLYGIYENLSGAGAKNYFANWVGIGKTNPSASLDVSGSVKITGSLSVTDVIDGTIQNAQTASLWTGNNRTTLVNGVNVVIDSIPTASYDAVHWHYTVKDSNAIRTGLLMGAWINGDYDWEERHTLDIGDVTSVNFHLDIVGGNATLYATTSGPWTIKLNRIFV